MDGLETVSLSTTVMNRLWMLKQTLPAWLLLPFKNVYVLNWNSDDSEELHEFVKSLKDDRVIVEDAFGKRTAYFMAAISRNMAAERCMELTRPKYLFQIDCDVITDHSHINNERFKLYDGLCYFAKCTKEVCQPGWSEKEWDAKKYTTNPEWAKKNRLKYGTFGSCIIPADKVWKYGYYNENFIENALFDVYYISKFVDGEPENIWFFDKELIHLDHSNEERVKNTPENDLVRGTMINKALSVLPPYRYKYTVHERGKLEIN